MTENPQKPKLQVVANPPPLNYAPVTPSTTVLGTETYIFQMVIPSFTTKWLTLVLKNRFTLPCYPTQKSTNMTHRFKLLSLEIIRIYWSAIRSHPKITPKISMESSYPTSVLVIGSYITCYEAHEFTYYKNAVMSHKSLIYTPFVHGNTKAVKCCTICSTTWLFQHNKLQVIIKNFRNKEQQQYIIAALSDKQTRGFQHNKKYQVIITDFRIKTSAIHNHW